MEYGANVADGRGNLGCEAVPLAAGRAHSEGGNGLDSGDILGWTKKTNGFSSILRYKSRDSLSWVSPSRITGSRMVSVFPVFFSFLSLCLRFFFFH